MRRKGLVDLQQVVQLEQLGKKGEELQVVVE